MRINLRTVAQAVPLIVLLLSARALAQQHDALQNDYDQLTHLLAAQITAQQVHIALLQHAIKVDVESDLLFSSGSWQMPPQAA